MSKFTNFAAFAAANPGSLVSTSSTATPAVVANKTIKEMMVTKLAESTIPALQAATGVTVEEMANISSAVEGDKTKGLIATLASKYIDLSKVLNTQSSYQTENGVEFSGKGLAAVSAKGLFGKNLNDNSDTIVLVKKTVVFPNDKDTLLAICEARTKIDDNHSVPWTVVMTIKAGKVENMDKFIFNPQSVTIEEVVCDLNITLPEFKISGFQASFGKPVPKYQSYNRSTFGRKPMFKM